MLAIGAPRLLIVFGSAAAASVAALLLLVTGSWWALLVSVLVLFAGFAVAVRTVMAMLTEGEKDDPVSESRAEHEAARLRSRERRRERTAA